MLLMHWANNKHDLLETCRLLPESVVWLYANNRVAEAEQIIRNAAKLNNISMPDKILTQSEISVTVGGDGEKVDDNVRNINEHLLDKFRNSTNLEATDKTKDVTAQYSVLDIFRNRRLTVNLFGVMFMW